MKKKYKNPEILCVTLGDEIMDDVTLQSTGVSAGVNGQNDTDWGFNGDGKPGDTPDAKTSGRFWDDEY